MIELLLFFVIPNACSPLDWTDCGYTIISYESTHNWGRHDGMVIMFGGDWYNKTDCRGLTYWQHEWLHAKYGPFHKENQSCEIRDGFRWIVPIIESMTAK